MPNNMRVDLYEIKRYYNWRMIDDVVSNTNMYNTNTHIELQKPVINYKKINKRSVQLFNNYYYQYFVKSWTPETDFKTLNKQMMTYCNNYYYEYFNKFNEIEDKIIQSNESWCLEGPAGTGKSTLIKRLQKRLDKEGKTYVTLAPTNLAALIIGGMTIHKFCTKCRNQTSVKNMDIDYIFVDEISMVREVFYKFFLMIKKIRPDIKFIISGDYNQLKPVADRISRKTNYSISPALFELCDSNKIKLTICRRADDTFFKLIDFKNINNLTTADFNNITKYETAKHLAFTNEKRKQVNEVMMKQVWDKRGRKGILLPALPYDIQSQEVRLNVGLPIISKINCEEMDIVNNERFEITEISKTYNKITMKSEQGKIIKIRYNDFQKYFRCGFCTTVHSSQGLSIGEKYTLHEWNKYNVHLKYVALSRARAHELINIMV